jgi:hypothetical protein
VHYRIARVCRVPGAHGKAQITHGEGFAVCCSRQRTHGKLFHGEPYFCSRPNYGHTAKLCRKSILTHGKEKITNGGDGLKAGFAVCRHTAKSQCLPCARVGHTANPNEKKTLLATAPHYDLCLYCISVAQILYQIMCKLII